VQSWQSSPLLEKCVRSLQKLVDIIIYEKVLKYLHRVCWLVVNEIIDDFNTPIFKLIFVTLSCQQLRADLPDIQNWLTRLKRSLVKSFVHRRLFMLLHHVRDRPLLRLGWLLGNL
jgi:hypothetical protein